MKINELVRKLIVELYTPRPPKPPRQPPKFVLVFRRIIASLKFIISTTLKILFLIPFTVFIVIWIFVFSVFWSGHYLLILGEEGTTQLAIIGMFSIVFVGMIVYARNETAFQNTFRHVYNEFKKTSVYKKLSEWVYKISALYFAKLLLPNIDLIEPGLTNQESEFFPEKVFYKDGIVTTAAFVRSMLSKYTNLAAASVAVSTVSLIIVPLVFTLISSILNLITFGVLKRVFDFLPELSLYVMFTFFITTFIVLIHPESIINKRGQALRDEFFRLKNEEYLQEKISEIEKDAKSISKQYDELRNEIRENYYIELKKLSDVQQKRIVTQKEIEEAHALMRDKKDVVGFILNEHDELMQESQEKREKMVRWKNWIIDIGIGIISALLFRLLFG